MVFAGDEVASFLSAASKTARGSASKGTGVRQKRFLNATVTTAPVSGVGSVVVDGANTASSATWPSGYSANTGDRVLVTLIGRALQVTTAQTGSAASNGVASVTAGIGLNSTGAGSNPTLNSLVELGRVATVSGTLPASIAGEDGDTYTLFTGQFNVHGTNTSNTTGVPANSTPYNVGDPVMIRLTGTSGAVVIAKLA